MSRSAHRSVLTAVAVASLLANGGGLLLTLLAGDVIAGWQLNSLGVGVPASCLGLLVAWHRPRNRISWLFLAAGGGFALSQLGLGVLAQPSAPAWALKFAYLGLLLLPGPLTIAWTLLILLFPDGRVASPAWRRVAVAATAVALGAACLQLLVAPRGYLPQEYGLSAPDWLSGLLPLPGSGPPLWTLLDLPGLLLPAVAVAGLLARYRTASATVRQQIKWLGVAAAVVVGVDIVFLVLGRFAVGEPPLVSVALAPLPTLGAALAIFKYRLWDIDRLLSRTLAFAVLWGAASLGLMALAAMAGLAAGGLDLRVLVAVTLSLLAALVLQPLRSRLEEAIARLIYGPRPRGFSALSLLSDAEPEALPVRELAGLVSRVATDAVGVGWASVWLEMAVDGRSLLKLAGSQGGTPGGPTEVIVDEGRAVEALGRALPEPPATILSLAASQEVVGLLAVGPRAGAAELTEDDEEVLALVARQAAVLLRAGRLEEELRERVHELRESRQRLVAAQDAERRRLERDLHDGVQQRLVALAVRLKRSSRAGAAQIELESMAMEAEEAVFAMQDVARGIYPSVLVDSGVVAALRARAARLPLDVRLDVDPTLASARFAPDVEACLYFVAMEAMTNVQKHAHTAAVTIALRSEAPCGGLVLEVHDSGSGFEPKAGVAGSGLQNMRDRLAALNGEVRITSRPGAGTWVIASLPLPGAVVELQRVEGGSRR